MRAAARRDIQSEAKRKPGITTSPYALNQPWASPVKE